MSNLLDYNDFVKYYSFKILRLHMMEYRNNCKSSQKNKNKRFGWRDLILLVIIFVVLIAVFAGSKRLHQESGTEVVISVDGSEFGRYPLASEQEVEITNSSGDVTNHLVIKNGKADMTDAACPDHLCVRQKAISHQGETIVCLPNKVVVSIEGGEEAPIDTVAQ